MGNVGNTRKGETVEDSCRKGERNMGEDELFV